MFGIIRKGLENIIENIINLIKTQLVLPSHKLKLQLHLECYVKFWFLPVSKRPQKNENSFKQEKWQQPSFWNNFGSKCLRPNLFHVEERWWGERWCLTSLKLNRGSSPIQVVGASNEAIRKKIQNLLHHPNSKLKQAVLHIVLAPEFTHSI